jgi:exodeoxyribonuclease I
MTNIFVYDTEGTGVLTRYDRPFQFASCIYDEHTNLLRTSNLRGRLPSYVLPDPEALLVTGQTMKGIQASTLSHYEFIGRVHEEIVINSPSIIMSYNGIRYDEEVLRHSFYANLRAPYVTQFDGNERMDVFIAAKTIAGIDPKAFEIPIGRDDKPTFKLEGLAEANGFSNHKAHDAVGDVKATMHIARTMQRSAGRAWDACSRNRSKVDVLKLLRTKEPLVHIGWSHEAGKSFYQLIQPVTTDETNLNEWLCVDLEADVDALLARTIKDLSQDLVPKLGLSAALKVKANAMPMVFSLDTAVSLDIEVPDMSRTAASLMADKSFPGVNGRVKVGQRAAQNVATLCLG